MITCSVFASVPVVVTLPCTINLPNDEEIEDVEMKFDDKVITGEKVVCN